MKSLASRVAILLSLALIGAAAPARADFYRLEGRFQCLERGDAACVDTAPSTLAAALAEPPVASTPHDAAPAPAPPPEPPAVLASEPPPPAAASAPVDPVLAIARRVKAEHPDSGDVAALRHAVDEGDSRAMELLAWCVLRGVGAPRDPVEAYFLYGLAASNDVPHARENQALVYERALNPQQREQVLLLQARPAHGARTLAANGGETPERR